MKINFFEEKEEQTFVKSWYENMYSERLEDVFRV